MTHIGVLPNYRSWGRSRRTNAPIYGEVSAGAEEG